MSDSTFLLDATLRTRVEELTTQANKFIFPEMSKRSQVMDQILKAKTIGGIGGKPMSLPTFDNNHMNVYIDGNYPTTTANKNDFWIRIGDKTKPTVDRNNMKATFESADVGWAMQITKADMIAVQGGSKTAMANKFIEWWEKYWNRKADGFTISMLDAIYNGSGTATRLDGESRTSFIGLDTAISTDSYGGKTPDDWGEWKSHVYDTAGTIFGIAASVTDTIAHMITKQTDVATSYFYRLIYGMTLKFKMFNPTGANGIIIMTPAQYQYLWLPVVEAQRQGIAPRATGSETTVLLNEWQCNGYPIVVEDTLLPTDNKGTSFSYLKANTYIDMINLDDMYLAANSIHNFEATPLERIPGSYQVYEKDISATLLFYMARRWGSLRLKLQSALVTVLDGYSNPEN